MGIFDAITSTFKDISDPLGMWGLNPEKLPELPAWQTDVAKRQAGIALGTAQNAADAADRYYRENPLLNPSLINNADPYSNQANNGENGLIANAQRAVSGQTGRDLSAPSQAALADTAAAGRAVMGSDNANAAAQTADTQRLRLAASGLGGPSAAENLAQDVLQRNVQSQAALAAKARGGNVAAAMRAASTSGTQQALQAQAQVAALRAQEQATARGQLVGADQGARAADQARAAATAGALGQVSGQQVGLAGTNAGLVASGLSGLNAGAQNFQQGVATQAQLASATRSADQAYLDYLQRMYATASGIPAQYATPQAALIASGTEANQRQKGALISGGGAAVAGVL